MKSILKLFRRRNRRKNRQHTTLLALYMQEFNQTPSWALTNRTRR